MTGGVPLPKVGNLSKDSLEDRFGSVISRARNTEKSNSYKKSSASSKNSKRATAKEKRILKRT